MAMSEFNIIGYVDPLISFPGDSPAVKVSCSQPKFTSQVFRLGAGYRHPGSPPVSHRRLESIPQRTHDGKPQFGRIGSFARVPSWGAERLEKEKATLLRISFWCQAALPEDATHDQFLFSCIDSSKRNGFECWINESGRVIFRIGSLNKVHELTLFMSLERYRWYYLVFTINLASGTLTYQYQTKARDIGDSPVDFHATTEFEDPVRLDPNIPLTIGADSLSCQSSTEPIKSGSFNGKIQDFKVESVSASGDVFSLVDFDFSLDIPTDKIRDVSGNKHHGVLVNAPSRAVTGYDWDPKYSDWTQAPKGYGAIHFHDDDLDDAMWDSTFQLDLPQTLRSGCYGVYLDDGKTTDIVPFFIRPDPNAEEIPSVALIIPTFTYAAYANEHLHDESRDVHFPGDPDKKDKYFRTLMKRPDLGISLYDGHNDGSGTVFSTLKRPVMNMRPDYSMWLFDGPREFSADLWFVDFLDREVGKEGYDVITDHDISEFGAGLLKKYRVLLSCSHPEYPTYNMLDAYTAFLENGGHFMYLGGNGYYWVTTHDPARPHRIEVRRAEAGCRTFGLPPGNWHHSLTGEMGGLWRSRGRPPNVLFGLGSCAMGVGKGVGYGINDEARKDPDLSFVFRGLQSDTIIGDFGLVQGAASGDEIDRLDYSLGSPKNAILIATTKLAGGHSDDYMLFNEETLYPMVNLLGTTSDKIRSDVVFFKTASGGAVFSVGSINWVGAMAWNAYANNVARMTANVLHDFILRSQ